MTNEELDEARAKEAWRIYGGGMPSLATIAARLAREGWTPPEPVDPDVLAYREWRKSAHLDGCSLSSMGRICLARGDYDGDSEAQAYLAGARMARAQEQERAEVLVEYVRAHVPRVFAATEALAAYKAGKAAQ
jgi:hypothetical protein